MSADNYAVCPRCMARARKAEADQLAEVMASYGRVPVAEFDQKRAAISTPAAEHFITFREDYEIYGAGDGVVTVDYGGSCEVCGLSLSFTDKRPIPGLEGTS